MNRAEKTENVAALTDDFAKASVAVLAEYRGLTAGQMNRLRRVVREADGRCRVTKNRLAKRAIGATGGLHRYLRTCDPTIGELQIKTRTRGVKTQTQPRTLNPEP